MPELSEKKQDTAINTQLLTGRLSRLTRLDFSADVFGCGVVANMRQPMDDSAL
jgi:hypothetical protein